MNQLCVRRSLGREQQVQKRPLEKAIQDGRAAVQGLPEHGLRLVQLFAHPRVLRPLPREQEGNLRRCRAGHAARAASRLRVARVEIQRPGQLRVARARQGEPVLEVFAPRVDAVAEISQWRGRTSLDSAFDRFDLALEGVGAAGRQRQHVRGPLHGRLACGALGRFLDHDVGVGAPHAERAQSGAAGQSRARPFDAHGPALPRLERPLNVERPQRKRNLRVWLRRGDRRQQHAVLQLEQDLDEPHDTGASLEVADVRLDRSDAARLRHLERRVLQFGRPVAERQPADLDRVAQPGSRSVRLDVRDGPRVNGGRGEAAPNGLRLGLRIRRREPDGAVSRAEAGALDDAVDAIAAL